MNIPSPAEVMAQHEKWKAKMERLKEANSRLAKSTPSVSSPKGKAPEESPVSNTQDRSRTTTSRRTSTTGPSRKTRSTSSASGEKASTSSRSSKSSVNSKNSNRTKEVSARTDRSRPNRNTKVTEPEKKPFVLKKHLTQRPLQEDGRLLALKKSLETSNPSSPRATTTKAKQSRKNTKENN